MKFLDWCKASALVSLAVFLGFGSYLLWVTAQNQNQLAAQASVVLAHSNQTLTSLDMSIAGLDMAIIQMTNDITATRTSIQGVASGLDKTIALINANCPKGDGTIHTVDDDKGCGLLANVNTTLRTARGAIGQVETAGRNFDKNEATFYTQEVALYAQGLQAVKNFNDLVTSKDLTDAIHHGAGVVSNVDSFTFDVQKKTHEMLNPAPCVGKFCGVRKFASAVINGSKATETLYYAVELWKATH